METKPSTTIRKRICKGHIYCTFVEGREGEFNRLELKGNMSRETDCGESWLQPMAKLLTFSLRRAIWEGTTERAIIKHLKGHRCNSMPPNKDHVCSCTDAICKCIEEYFVTHPIAKGSLASDYQTVSTTDHSTLTNPYLDK